MSWSTEITLIVRTMINDLDSPYTYTDARIQKAIVIAGQILNSQIDFDYTYTFDINNSTITPDPTSYPDLNFITLVSLQAVCIIIGGEYKISSQNAIKVTDAWSSIDMSGQASALKALLANFEAKLLEARQQYIYGNMKAVAAILSPYTVSSTYFQQPFY